MSTRDLSFINRYFNVNKILLLIVGLWPYRQTRLVRLQVILIHGILISGIVVQLNTIVAAKFTRIVIIKILCTVLPYGTCVLTYNTFWTRTDYFKYMLDQLQQIYDNLKDKNEISIVEKYGSRAKRNVIIVTQFGALSMISIILGVWMGEIILPSKEFRSRRIKQINYFAEYFVDPEQYFTLILIHMNILICSTIITSVGIGLIIIVYVRHICVIFRIASYRIKQAMTNKLLNNMSLHGENAIRKRIIYAIEIQRKAMGLSIYLLMCFNKLSLFNIPIFVALLSLNYFEIFQLMSLKGDIEQLALHVLCAITVYTILYVFCNNGQDIMNHSNHVFFTAYNLRWYKAPLRVQKLLILLLQRSNKVFSLNFYGLITISLELFATITSASVSYFTVIYSTAQ